ncbi:MAG: hypothetical protein J6D03_00020 [Clostridia bacterium]|nr:hypothetical protein [Clostridia bacterium]
MISFPSTLNRGGANLNLPNVSNSTKDVIKDAFKQAFNKGLSAITTGADLDTVGIRYDATIDKAALLDNTNLAYNGQISFTHKVDEALYKYEDPFHMPLAAIDSMNKYKVYIWDKDIQYSHKATKRGDSSDNLYGKVGAELSGSLFNPYYGMLRKGPTPSTPLMTNQDPNYVHSEDCTIKNLVKLSNESGADGKSPLGQARYKYSDFMYCKDLGKIANNHLITLRRFSTPVGDNIFTEAAMPKSTSNFSMMGDIGRLVTWFGNEDNKLEDILKYDYVATWKEISNEIKQQHSKEGEGTDEGAGFKNIANKAVLAFGNTPYSYKEAIEQGTNPAFRLPFFNKLVESGQYQNDPVILGENYDEHKVYEPKNTIRKIHIYDGELTFNHEFTLVFNYTLRAYDNINPKAAFLDLLGNIMVVTYRRGHYWAGQNEVLGVQQDTQGWRLAHNIIHKGVETTRAFISQLITGGGKNFAASMLGSIGNAAKDFMDYFKQGASTAMNAIKNGDMQSIAANLLNDAASLSEGLLKNYLGRPSVYQFNSLIAGNDTGTWHLTIGNPLNPIAVMGNLILTKSEIQHYGPLGVDDFPTGLKVTVSLKHAMPRDATKIERMYTEGLGTIYQSLNNIKDITQIYNLQQPPVADRSSEPSSDVRSASKPKEIHIDKLLKTINKPLKISTPEIHIDKLLNLTNAKEPFQIKTGQLMNQNLIKDGYNYLGDYDIERINANRDQLT